MNQEFTCDSSWMVTDMVCKVMRIMVMMIIIMLMMIMIITMTMTMQVKVALTFRFPHVTSGRDTSW